MSKYERYCDDCGVGLRSSSRVRCADCELAAALDRAAAQVRDQAESRQRAIGAVEEATDWLRLHRETCSKAGPVEEIKHLVLRLAEEAGVPFDKTRDCIEAFKAAVEEDPCS